MSSQIINLRFDKSFILYIIYPFISLLWQLQFIQAIFRGKKKTKKQSRIIILSQTDIEQIFPRSKWYLGRKVKEKKRDLVLFYEKEKKRKKRWFEIFPLFHFLCVLPCSSAQ